MPASFNKQSPFLLGFLEKVLRPFIHFYFRPKIVGLENLPDEKVLFISNHNVGALIESHLLLLLYREKFQNKRRVFGFTHPSLFVLPVISHYFLWIGSVPATYEVAADVFNANESLLIFPGGNEQALRPVWKYRENDFRKSHGWAKIAWTHQVKVVPVTFKYTHFVNPVIISSILLSKILIIPSLLGVRVSSVTISQILFGAICFYLGKIFAINLYLNLFLTSWIFLLTSLIPILPVGIEVKIHPSFDPKKLSSQDDLEDQVQVVYQHIY